MAKVLAEAAPLSDVVWRQLLGEHQTDTPERRAGLERAAAAKAQLIADETVRVQYARLFKDRLFELFRPERKAFTPGNFGGNFGGKSGGRSGAKFGNHAFDGTTARLVPPTFGPSGKGQRPVGDAGTARRLRERILLATLINHPGLMDHVEERLGSMQFADSRLDSLRQSALMHIAQNQGLDFEALGAHLAKLGFAEELGKLLNSDTYVHAAFALPVAAADSATTGWDHTFTLCQRADLEADLKQAEIELAENPSEHTLAAYKALLDLVRPSGD